MFKKIDGFIVSLICMIVTAYFFPQLSGEKSPIHLETFISIGMSLIFFFYGLKLSPQQMKQGLSNYRLHILVQVSTFIFFPLLTLLLYPLAVTEETRLLWLALFFMAALPSTVSSSVVMVSIAKGNIPGAIFNASISGLIGVLVTPLWIGLFLNTSGVDFNFTQTVLSLIYKIIIPVILGLSLNRFWGKYARKHSKYLTLFDKTVILSIVYNSFSKSFVAGIFSSIPVYYLVGVALIIMGLFFAVYGLMYLIARRLHFSREDKIAALFCGSKKSLIHGSVMAGVLFKGMTTQGLFIVPIMVYHSFQLIVVSFIAQKFAKEKK